MAGFANDIVYANNGDFSIAGSTKGQLANGLISNGQLWIGSTANNVGGTHINVGNITSPLGTVNVGYSSPNITIDVVSSSAFMWSIVTSADNVKTLVKANGYIAKGAGVVQFILPAAAAVGDTFWIKGYGNLWTLAQNAGQSVSLGSLTSTVGVSGSLSATQVKDGIEILCVTANTEFEVIDCIGNPTII